MTSILQYRRDGGHTPLRLLPSGEAKPENGARQRGSLI
jgi:hypothetical protein